MDDIFRNLSLTHIRNKHTNQKHIFQIILVEFSGETY